MARKVDRLNALQIAKLKKPGYFCDGAGLYLQVASGGSKSWVFRYTLSGRQREMGLGSFQTFSLAEARLRAAEQRKKLADGIDPIEDKNSIRLTQRLAAEQVITFDKAAELYVAANESGWRSEKHGAQWRSTLATYASPVIGKSPVHMITTAKVMDVLLPIWTTKTETASRVRGRIESVLDWAKVQGYRSGDNPAAWKGNLAEALPKPSKVADAGHHAALPWKDIANFMSDLRTRHGGGAESLQLIILTSYPDPWLGTAPGIALHLRS